MTEAEKAYQYFVIAVPESEEQAKAYFWARKALQPTLTPPNEALTIEQLRQMDEPVWCSCKPIEGGNGYWCLCRYGKIVTPSGNIFDVDKIPHWMFYRRPPEGEEERHGD